MAVDVRITRDADECHIVYGGTWFCDENGCVCVVRYIAKEKVVIE